MKRISFALTLVVCISLAAPELSAAGTTRARRAPVVLIVMENHEYGSIVGSSSAPYLNRRFIRRGTLYTNYYAVRHPSLPNYLAMTSGTTSGCDSDDCPRKRYRTNNIFHQLLAAGIKWNAWAESMPSRCDLSSSGSYVVHHNPPAYYANLFPRVCRYRDRRYPSKLPRRLAPFTFIIPNNCHNMHDCSVATGDRWLRNHVPKLLGKGAVVIITFDEGTGSQGGGGHVMTAVAGPHVRHGFKRRTRFTHFGLLAGLEKWFGVARLHAAAKARPLPL